MDIWNKLFVPPALAFFYEYTTVKYRRHSAFVYFIVYFDCVFMCVFSLYYSLSTSSISVTLTTCSSS